MNDRLSFVDDNGMVFVAARSDYEVDEPPEVIEERRKVNTMLEFIRRAQGLAVQLGLSFSPTIHADLGGLPGTILEHAAKDDLGELVTLQPDRSAATAHVCYRLGSVDLFVVTRRGQQISQGEIDQAIARDRDREAALIQANAQAALI